MLFISQFYHNHINIIDLPSFLKSRSLKNQEKYKKKKYDRLIFNFQKTCLHWQYFFQYYTTGRKGIFAFLWFLCQRSTVLKKLIIFFRNKRGLYLMKSAIFLEEFKTPTRYFFSFYILTICYLILEFFVNIDQAKKF